MKKAVAERHKFVHKRMLCFGCLKSGYRSRSCKNRSACDIDERKHPTCLHEDHSKGVGKQRMIKSSKERSTAPLQNRRTNRRTG